MTDVLLSILRCGDDVFFFKLLAQIPTSWYVVSSLKFGRFVHLCSLAMIHSYELAPILQGIPPGKVVCCVAIPVCMDFSNHRHLMATVPQNEQFVFSGILKPGQASYSFLRVEVQPKNGHLPELCGGKDAMIFSHQACTWSGTRQIIELCCGMGALGHGAKASGFKTVVGCDIRPRMLELFQLHSDGKPVLGDISEFVTLKSIFEAHPFSCVIASGIACQPYSQLGDQRSGADPRASTLPATLAAAFYLRAMIVVIECVGPAQKDPFVQHHIRNFCLKTGFKKSECIMDLKDFWASKRNRWWCVLSAPAIGVINIGECVGFPDLPNVGNLIPQLCPWPTSAEDELALTPVEIEAFQPSGQTSSHHLLNTRAPMACALHCWGSQLMGCPCGCREYALSKSRLEAKGLFGVLAEGVLSKKTRHLHPQEAGALCGLDPCLKWGECNRLALSAVGQLASPLQALWIFSHIIKQLQVVQYQAAEASPIKMMMAYRSWLLARCVKQWGVNGVHFPPTETLELARRWKQVVDMSFTSLLESFPPQSGDNHAQKLWDLFDSRTLAPPIVPDDLQSGENVAGTLTPECPSEDVASFGEGVDHGLSLTQVAIDLSVDESLSEVFQEEDLSSIEAVSQSISCSMVSADQSVSTTLLEDVQLVIHGDCGEVDLSQSGGRKAWFRYGSGSTIEDVLAAESELQSFESGSWEVYDLADNADVAVEHVCQLIQIPIHEQLRPGMKCRIRHVGNNSDSDRSSQSACKRIKSSNSDTRQHSIQHSGVDSPLLRLQRAQFTKLLQPIVSDPFHAVSLLLQTCPFEVREKVLGKQADIWADDEIRWHLGRIQNAAFNFPVVPIEPLLIHGWLETLNFDHVSKWLQYNATIDAIFVTAVLQAGHWFPLMLDCRNGQLSVSTWDLPNASHVGLQEFCKKFAVAVSVSLGPITQHSRIFAGDGLCGAASIAYLEHRVCGTQLPDVRSALETLHCYYRQIFVQAISSERLVSSPWIWGAGVDASFDQVVNDLTPLLVDHGVPKDHAHHRAVKAVKAIGAADVKKALSGKMQWKTLKTLGSNVKFQFILPEELQAQIAKRAGKEAVGRPKPKGKSHLPDQDDPVVLDPSKLTIPEGSFVGGGKPVPQIPLSLLGPLAEGVALATWQTAEPYLKSSQILAKGCLAMLVLHGPVGGCATTLSMQKVTVPARCSVNNEPLLLEACLVQLGGIQVSRAVTQSPVPIDTVKVATLKIVIFKDECWQPWEEITAAPMRYIIQNIPLLRCCKQADCTCPHWHNHEKVEATESIVDVWRRQFLRAGYRPEPVATSTIFSVCIRVPECLNERLLACSGSAGIYLEPRSLDSRSVSSEYEVVWVPKAGKAELCHLRQVNPAVIGIARVNERYGLRVRAAQAEALHKSIRPDAVYLSHGARQHFVVGPIPYGTDRKALSKSLSQSSWEAKPLQPVSALSGERGVMWSVVALVEPPNNIVSMSHGDVVITKAKEPVQEQKVSVKPVAAPETISLCGSSNGSGKTDPWVKADPWSNYVPSGGTGHHQAGLSAAAESIHQLESKIETAVLAKLPQCFAMDQDDVADRVQDLESRFNQLMQRQQQLEVVVNEHGSQQTAQLGQMQTQLNAQGQQLANHMAVQQQQISNMFESQMAQIRGLLSKRGPVMIKNDYL